MSQNSADSRICNPARHRKDGETCLSLEALEKMKTVWNKTHPNRTIRSITRKNSQTKRAILYKELRNSMKSYYDCQNEYCTLKKMPGLSKKDRETWSKKYFRPEKPDEWNTNEKTWLDSFNIEDVMNQYEDSYKDFEFIGPVPIDFDAPSDNSKLLTFGKCIVDELCKLDLEDAFKKGTKRLGIIFNLDKHDEPGSHWVCAFIDIPNKSAYYFDSYGLPPPPEISALLERCKAQGCETILYNDIRHQRKDSECGMYCLYTIISLLRGKSFSTICMDIVDDDSMNAFRDVLFASEKPRKTSTSKEVLKLGS